MILFGVWIFSETRYPESRGMEPRLSINHSCSAGVSAGVSAGLLLPSLPSVAQVPLPLQEFLPPAPLPLHEFCPAQACFSVASFLVAHFERNASLRAGVDGVRSNGERTAHQAGDCCAGNHCFSCHVTFLFLCWFFWPNFRTTQYVREPGKKVTFLYTPHPASI
jgi:hypothetical protein